MLKIILLIILIFLLIFIGLFIFSKKIFEPETIEQTSDVIDKNKTDQKTKNMDEPKTNIKITTLYDNYQINKDLKTGWGFSCLVEVNDKQILFDTGADSPTLLTNMKKLGIDTKNFDLVFISHLHHDHTGGLDEILKINPNLPVYKPENFNQPTKIFDNVWSTGAMSGPAQEHSLVINTEDGLIIITGCAHPGIINIIEKAKQLFADKPIKLVLGGFHLSSASDSQLEKIISKFQELEVRQAAPCHCSGEKCRELFKQIYQDNYIENGVGKIIEY